MFPSLLETPFFTDDHRRLASDVQEWAAKAIPAIESQPIEDGAKTRLFAKGFGEAGWLRLFGDPSDDADSVQFDVRSICIVREILTHHSGLADACFAVQGLGSAPILLFGTPEQRARYLPHVARGSWLPSFALSEANSGSDAAAIETSAERRGDKFVINGTKTWIGNAGVADFYIVFARTGEAPGSRGITAFIVDKDTPGFEVSEQFQIVAPHVIGSLSFENCLVGEDQILGVRGEGFKIAMAILDIYRSTVGAAAVGYAKRAFQEVLAHSTKRRIFGQYLSDFQATKMRLADMAAQIEASSLLVYRSAWTRDVLKRRITYESSLAKMVGTENAQQVIDGAVQLMGGLGVKKGSVVEQLYREIRPLRIYEGATEIQKLVIAGQLLKRWTTEKAL